MPIPPPYTPPSLATVQSFLNQQPPQQHSDHEDETDSLVRVDNSAPTQEGTVLSVSLVPNAVLANELNSTLSVADVSTSKKVFRLTVGNVPAPADTTSYLQLFIGRAPVSPANASNHPNHFRNVAFFCCHGGDSVGPFNFIFDVTARLHQLKKNGESVDKQVTIYVLAGSLTGPAPAIVPGFFTLEAAA